MVNLLKFLLMSSMSELIIDSSIDIRSSMDYPLNVLFHLCKTYMTLHPDSVPDYYAFGGCVRDFINGDKPNDIDFYISDPDLCDFVLQTLSDTGRIDGNFKKTQRYSELFQTFHFSFVLNSGELFPVDLVTRTLGRNSIQYFQDCDFTCNNLLMRSDGTIKTRESSPNAKMLPSDWTVKCIRDAITKNLVWMTKRVHHQTFEEKLEHSFKMEERLTKMLKKGYTNSNVSLTGFKLIIPKTHLWWKKHGLPESENFCAICRDNYDDDPRSIMLECGHDYHFKCIKKWKTNKNSCPTCRGRIYYSLESRLSLYGCQKIEK